MALSDGLVLFASGVVTGVVLLICINKVMGMRSKPDVAVEKYDEGHLCDIQNLNQIGNVVQFDVDGELYATEIKWEDKRMVWYTEQVYHVRTGLPLESEVSKRVYQMWRIRRSMNLASKVKLPYAVVPLDNFHNMDSAYESTEESDALVEEMLTLDSTTSV